MWFILLHACCEWLCHHGDRGGVGGWRVMVTCSAEVQLVGVHLVGLLGTAEWLGGRPGRSLLMKAAQLTCSMSQCSITCSMPAPFSKSTRTPLLNKMISCRPYNNITTLLYKLHCLHRHADLTPEVTAACGERMK